MEIVLFKLSGDRWWCEVCKFKGGLYLIRLELEVFVYVDFKRGFFVILLLVYDILEIIVLVCFVFILYLFCKLYILMFVNEFLLFFYKKVKSD